MTSAKRTRSGQEPHMAAPTETLLGTTRAVGRVRAS